MWLEVVRWSEADAPSRSALERRLASEGFGAYAWTDPARVRYEPHAHDRDETIWCVDGAITFTVDGVAHALGPGDRLMLPAGTVHAAEVGREGATYLIGTRGSGTLPG